MLAKNSQWLWLLILITPLATASHSVGGLLGNVKSPTTEERVQLQQYLELTKLQGPHPVNSISSSVTSTANKKNASPVNLGSWLALGPFLLLVILGLARWWVNSRKYLNRQMRPQL